MDEFGEYIQYLLPAVFKRNKKTNQLLIFCKILGLIYDDIKTALFQLREESMIETCSDCMLEVAGQDRDMNQLKGETYSSFRKRLMMKAQVAEMAGTLKGIQYALEAVGYSNCSIEPLWKTDPDRWAEININFLTASVDEDNTIDFHCIVEEVMKVKKASTLPHYIFFYPAVIEHKETTELKVINRFTSFFFEGILYLDGSWNLNGSQKLNSELSPILSGTVNRFVIPLQETVDASIIVKHNLWYLDGTVLLDGNRLIDAYITQEVLE